MQLVTPWTGDLIFRSSVLCAEKANERFFTGSQAAKIHVIVGSAKYNKPWFYMYLRTKRPRIRVAADFENTYEDFVALNV